MAHVSGFGPTADVVNISSNTTSNAEFSLIGTNDTGATSSLSKFTSVTVNPSTSTLTATNFNGFIKTVGTTAATAHYLNFSDAATTGFGNPQKNAALSVIPSTGVVTAGGLNIGNLGISPSGTTVNLTSTGNNIIEIIGAFRVNSAGGTAAGISIGASGQNTATIDIAAGNGNNATGKTSFGGDSRKIVYIGCNNADSGTEASNTLGAINIGTSNLHGNNAPIFIGCANRSTTIRGSITSTATITGQRISLNETANASTQLGWTTINTTLGTFTTWTQDGTSDTNIFRNAATISFPAKQVSLIILSITATNNTASVSNTRYGVVISATQATVSGDTAITNSENEIAVGLASFTEPNMDTAVGQQDRRTLSGIYVNSTASAVSAYLNIQWKQAWTTAPTFSFNYTITKVG